MSCRLSLSTPLLGLILTACESSDKKTNENFCKYFFKPFGMWPLINLPLTLVNLEHWLLGHLERAWNIQWESHLGVSSQKLQQCSP
jgi:hypothetical protein